VPSPPAPQSRKSEYERLKPAQLCALLRDRFGGPKCPPEGQGRDAFCRTFWRLATTELKAAGFGGFDGLAALRARHLDLGVNMDARTYLKSYPHWKMLFGGYCDRKFPDGVYFPEDKAARGRRGRGRADAAFGS